MRPMKRDEGTSNVDRPPGSWRKSTRSWANSDCVEVGQLADAVVAVRDSRSPLGPILEFNVNNWNAFLAALRGGRASL